MKETLLFLVKQMVDHPDEVEIKDLTQDDRTILTIHAHTDDLGKIIGKNGRIIRAIRDVMKIMATKKAQYVDVVLSEEEKP